MHARTQPSGRISGIAWAKLGHNISIELPLPERRAILWMKECHVPSTTRAPHNTPCTPPAQRSSFEVPSNSIIESKNRSLIAVAARPYEIACRPAYVACWAPSKQLMQPRRP